MPTAWLFSTFTNALWAKLSQVMIRQLQPDQKAGNMGGGSAAGALLAGRRGNARRKQGCGAWGAHAGPGGHDPAAPECVPGRP